MTTTESTTTTTTTVTTTVTTTTATSEQQPGSEQQATKTTKDSGANFRESQPKEAVKGEKSTANTDNPEAQDTEKSDSRFGIAGKSGSKGICVSSLFAFNFILFVNKNTKKKKKNLHVNMYIK